MNYEPDFGEKLQIIKNNYRVFGALRTVRDFLGYWLTEGSIPDDFDERHGVDTKGSIEPQAAGITGETELENAVRYLPIRETVMTHLLDHALRDSTASDWTFIDLGCGKGRALLIAARRAFQSVIGVELSKQLSTIAYANVQRQPQKPSNGHGCRDVRVTCASAPSFEYPDRDILVYMYRPFKGAIFRATLQSLVEFRARTGRRVRIVICCPSEEYLLERHGGFDKRDELQVISHEHSWVVWDAR